MSEARTQIVADREDANVWRFRFEADADGDVSLDGEVVAQLRGLIDEAVREAVRVIVLESGAADVFCRGMNLRGAVAQTGQAAVRALADQLEAYAAALQALRTGPTAVVAVVDGDAKGGGVGLAAAADCIIATQAATFGFPEVYLGLMPAMVLPVLSERVGPQKTRWFAMSGATLSAEDARRLGLVDELVPDAPAAEKRLRAVLKRLMRASPAAVAHTKALSAQIAGLEPGDAVLVGARQTSKDVADPETVSAIRGFLDGDSPSWFARYKPKPPPK